MTEDFIETWKEKVFWNGLMFEVFKGDPPPTEEEWQAWFKRRREYDEKMDEVLSSMLQKIVNHQSLHGRKDNKALYYQLREVFDELEEAK